MKNILFLFFQFIFFHFTYSIIIFPFKTKLIDENLSPELIINTLYLNKEIIQLTIGEPKQIIKASLNLESYEFFFVEKKNDSNYYNSNISKNSYIKDNKPLRFYDSPFDYGIYVQDSILIKLNNESKRINISFILAINSTLNDCASIGLNYFDSSDDSNLNFLKEIDFLLHGNINLATIKYNNDYEGELIVGNFSDMNINKKNYFTANVDIKHIYTQGWRIYFETIKFNDEKYNGNNHIFFSIENGMIKGPIELNKIFLKSVFIKNKCNKYVLKSYMTFYYCDEDVDYSNFPDISFYNMELNYTFILKKEELFLKIKNKIYFLIYFIENSHFDNWVLGKPFLKKYQFYFDYQNLKIGFYKEEKNNNISYKIFVIIILILIIIILLFLIFKFHYSRKRRRRMNEIDDNYNYIASLNAEK